MRIYKFCDKQSFFCGISGKIKGGSGIQMGKENNTRTLEHTNI